MMINQFIAGGEQKLKISLHLIKFIKSAKFLNDDQKEYLRFLKTQKIIRKIDEIHIIDLNKNLLFSNLEDKSKYTPPLKQALELVLEDDRPLTTSQVGSMVAGLVKG